MAHLTQDDLINSVRSVSDKVQDPLSREVFERISGISQYHIYRLFPDGGWSELKRRAGIARHPRQHDRLEDDDILKELYSVVLTLGKFPTWSQFSNHAAISADVVRRRFGGRMGAQEALKAWIEQRDPTSPLLITLQELTSEETPCAEEPGGTTTVTSGVGPRLDGRQYGAPIQFRGLRHAPINEAGVVFLFGMVSQDLGFIVEAVHASYPDCVAKRRIDQSGERWQVVRIEFEFKSRNFRDHKHDPEGCDLIVCWEHNWQECPLDVVELKKVIDENPA